MFGASMVAAGVAVYKFSSHSYHFLKAATKPRTGEEVYELVFGKPHTPCVRVSGFFYPVVPVMDAHLALCFSTCPAETKRILAKYKFEVKKRSIDEVLYIQPDKCCNTFFNKQQFGDSILECLDLSGRDHHIAYISTDSCKAYYSDIYN